MFIAAASMYNSGLKYEMTDSLVKASGYKKPEGKVQRELYKKHGMKYIPLEKYVHKYISGILRKEGDEFDNGGTDDYDKYVEMKFDPKTYMIGVDKITYQQNIHHENHLTIHKEMIFDTLFKGQRVH